MKVFVRPGGKTPAVLGFYPDDSDVPNDAYGSGVEVLTLPQDAIKYEEREDGKRFPTLVTNWRERVEKAGLYSLAAKVAALHDLFEYLVKHGTDTAKWPARAKDRLAQIEKTWKP
jgi:hypothetical protein